MSQGIFSFEAFWIGGAGVPTGAPPPPPAPAPVVIDTSVGQSFVEDFRPMMVRRRVPRSMLMGVRRGELERASFARQKRKLEAGMKALLAAMATR